MEGDIVGLENNIRSTSATALSSTPSATEIDSISIELTGAIRYNAKGMEYHDHFSLRGFVAEVRERDWLKCYPFPLGDTDDKTDGQRQLLPPLDAPKHKWWRCKCCVDELCAEKGKQASISGSGAECSTAQVPRISNHQDLETAFLLEERRTNAVSSNVGYTDHLACLSYEKGKKAEVVKSTIIGNQLMTFGDNASGLVPSLKSASPINPLVMQEGHKNDTPGSEIDELTEPAIRNLKWVAKCAAESCKPREITVTGNQQHIESTKSPPKIAEATVAEVPDNGLKDQPTGYPLPDSENCNSLAHKCDNLSEKDSQDCNLDKLSSLHRKKARKVRLLTDLLGKNGYTKNEVRTRETQEKVTCNEPAALSILKGPQDKLDNKINSKILGQNRKRKIPVEEGDIFLEKVADKELPNTEEDADNDNAIQSTRSEVLWTGRILQNGLKRHWSNAESDTRPVMSKKKNKKIQEVDALPLEPPREEERENLGYVNGATQAGPTDNLDLKLAPAAFTGHEMPLFPLHGDSEKASMLSKRKGKMPQVVENIASISYENGMVTDIPMWQRNEDILRMGPIALYKEKGIDKRLQLSLAAPSNDRELVAPCNDKQLIPHYENRLSISLPRQVGTSKVDEVFRKEMETSIAGEPSICLPYGLNNIYDKGILGELSSQTASFRMPAMNENTHPSQVYGASHIYRQQTEITDASKTKRTVEAQNSSVSMKKQFNQKADNPAEHGNIDDIPMEIVELMAKNQYERGLPDTEITNCLLQANNLRMNQQMVNCVPMPSNGEMRLLGEETSQKRKSKGRNGFIVTGENDGIHKGKCVHYFSSFDANYLNISSRGKSHIPFAVGQVCQSKKKPPCDFPSLAGNSSGLIGASNCKWNEDTLGYEFLHNSGQDSGGCDRHKTILNPDGEAFRIWTATTSKHTSKGYDVPTKATSQLMNTDMFSHGSSYHNMKRHNNVQLFNLNTLNAGKPNTDYGTESYIRSRTGFPFPSKSSGIELQKSLRGSGDCYSNDTIPAMNLLSLMQSGTSFDVSTAGAMTPKGSSFPHDYDAKLDIGTSRDSSYMKHSPSNYFADNYMTHRSGCHFHGSPPFGASASLIQRDRSFLSDSNVTDQILHKSGKEKMKSPKSDTQIRTKSQKSTFTGGESHKHYDIVPDHHILKSFPAVPDHVSIGCLYTGNENYANLNLQCRDGSGASRPLRKSLEPKICTINRNPADFSAPDAGNAYMINGEDLRFEKVSLYINGGLGVQRGLKHRRNLKQTSQKGRTKH